MKRPVAAMLITQDMENRCFDQQDIERIAARTELRRAQYDEMTDASQTKAIEGADIAITGWGSRPLSQAMLEAAPELKLVCHAAGSVRHLVHDGFLAKGIQVVTARDANGRVVAEFAFGMMLVSMKAVWWYHQATSQGEWNSAAARDWIREPAGATVGIIGASHTGRHMIRLCKTLPLDAILVYDPYLTTDEAAHLEIEQVELDELMRRSDVVSLHAPDTAETRHMINAHTLGLMKDRAIFINTARGGCVDETALIAELRQGRLLACLDVTDPEPPSPDSPLYTLPNCILTPHIAGSLKENIRMHGRQMADAIEAFVEGKPLCHAIDLAHQERLA